MSDQTRIEWCDATWNPCTGCTPISEACEHCYAERIAGRNLPATRCPECRGAGFRHYYGKGPETCRLCHGLGNVGFTPTFHPDRLDVPLHWRKPRRIFVCSMSDLFHEAFTEEQIDAVFNVFAAAPQHTYMVLTKRPERAKEFVGVVHPNLWLGVTVEDQQRADERIPILLDTPAAVRFVSCEPLLSAIDLSRYLTGGMVSDKSRGCISDGTGVRHVLNRHEWAYLASPENGGRESCEHAVCQGASDNAESRDCSVSRSLAGAVLDSRGAHVGVRAPGGLDGREPSGDPDWSGDQPQGRRPGEQRPGESGIGDSTGEHAPCRPSAQASREEGAVRRTKRVCEGDGGRRAADSRTVGLTDDDSARDRDGVRPKAASCELHRDPQELGSREVTLDWVILGGETGPGARPMQPEWALDVYRQCKAAGVPFFFKKWGRVDARGLGDEYEAMETTRELPEVTL